jgi:hypothetical protein
MSQHDRRAWSPDFGGPRDDLAVSGCAEVARVDHDAGHAAGCFDDLSSPQRSRIERCTLLQLTTLGRGSATGSRAH